ncbi:MAG: hypothetical protein RIF32_14915, partial [Leptospirales bacterium]
MSDRIQRSVHYYRLLANKHAGTGLGENQARVYAELAELVGRCSTLEEIQQRMREQGYLEKPAQALYLDKLAAHKKAAEENDFPSVAQIYQTKFETVRADPRAAFTAGWEQEVARELNRIGDIVGALNEIFAAYLRYQGAHPADDARKKAARSILENAAVIQQNGASFEAVVDQAYFRRHSPLDDARYTKARDAIRKILAGDHGAADAADDDVIAQRTEAALKILKPQTSELKKIGRDFQDRC